MTRKSLLVVAGEPSGDQMAAAALRQLEVPSFGIGGPALASAGLEVLFRLEQLASMGVLPVLWRASALARAAWILDRALRRSRPAAALLTGFSDFNLRLGKHLLGLGVRVLWYGPPQVWAWRSWRVSRVRAACDALAVILPFEEAFWRQAGIRAEYVGHPALERPSESRQAVRERLGLTPLAEYVAVLPGSRSQEVRRHLVPMLQAVRRLRTERGALDARVVLAPGLPPRDARWAETVAASERVGVVKGTAPGVLPAFNAALCCSGTATVECAAALVPPVIVYKTDAVSARLARYLLSVRRVGLPNLLLNDDAFPELLQDRATADRMADAVRAILDHPAPLEACRKVRRVLTEPLGEGPDRLTPPSSRVAAILHPWLQ